MIKAAEESLNQMVSTMKGARFDPQTRSFVMPGNMTPTKKDLSALQDYMKLLREESDLKASMLSSFQALKGMPEYVGRMGQSEWDDIEMLPGIAPPEGVKRQGPKRPSAPSVNRSSVDDFMRRKVSSTEKYKIGQIYDDKQTGMRMEVIGFEEPDVLWLRPVK
jgi:hypothetical protein